MNEVKATIAHRYFNEPGFEDFSVSIENCIVTLKRTVQPDTITVCISGRKRIDHLRTLLFEIFDLFFIYLGSCPESKAITVNGIELECKYILDKYYPSRKYGKLLAVCDINADTITEATIQKLRSCELIPFFSLEYLLSSGYDDINIVHRIVLLLHIIEGIVSDIQRKNVTSDLQNLSKKSGKIGDHLLSVYFICKNGFFNYHRRYNCDILKPLGFSRRTFLKTATDTRNWYSHFLNDARVCNHSEKKTPITDGAIMLYFFEILLLASRIHLMEQLGLKPKDSNIKESYYQIHDWIMETKYRRNDNYKSRTYSLRKMLTDMNARVDALSKEKAVSEQ